jgi:predicted phage terminase large subunit-like protein
MAGRAKIPKSQTPQAKAPTVTAAQAAQEVLDRQKARVDLSAFAQYTMRHFDLQDFHRKLHLALDQVLRGEIRRLMIELPPRYGKTEGIRRFVPWAIGQYPDLQMMGIGYGDDFVVAEQGRPTRNTMLSPEYKALYPDITLSKDDQSVGSWSTEQGGGFSVFGANGPITGRGGQIIVIDDPVKNDAEVRSKPARDKLWSWFWTDVYTRLMPYQNGPGAIIMIMTRRHEDDILGRLIKDDEKGIGEGWTRLVLKALAEEDDPLGRKKGEALWESRYPAEELRKMQSNPVRRRVFDSLYQQNPSPETGEFFQDEWWQYYDTPPPLEGLSLYVCSDYATKEGEGDYTVHGLFGIDADDRAYLLRLWREQTTSYHWVEALIDMVESVKPHSVMGVEEQGQILRSVGPFLEKRMRERKVSWYREQKTSVKDKASRARAIQGRVQQGLVYLPANAPYLADLQDEMRRFPGPAEHDDIVDIFSLLGRALNETTKGRSPRAAKPDFVEGARYWTMGEILKNLNRPNRNRRRRAVVQAPQPPSIEQLDEQ